MNARLLRHLCAATVLATAGSLHAQAPLKKFDLDEDSPTRPPASGERRPVMRAEAIRPPRGVPEDAVATPVPRNTRPSPTPRKAKAVAVATPLPATKATPAPAPVEPADPGEIRISPQGTPRAADQAQMEIADSYYVRKQWETAAVEYQRYLDGFPAGIDVPTATFRLAESNRKTGNVNLAKAAYERVLQRFPASDFVGPSSFRLAELYYADKNYSAALPHFRKASARLKEPAVVAASKFYQARCLEATSSFGNKLEAVDLYKDLADAREPNPFQDASRLSLALLLRESNRIPDALKNIQQLAKQTQNAELRAQATVRAGIWLIDLKQPQKAEEELKKALAMPQIGQWKEDAQFGLIRLYYDSAKYRQVIESYAEFGKQLSADSQPEALLLVANSQRKTEHPKEALALYDQIMRDFESTPFAREAQYEQLATLYSQNSDKLLPAIDAFLQTQPEPPVRDKILLMKAETLFKTQDFQNAAQVYEPVTSSTSLPANLKAEALFKLGWCETQTRDFNGAIKAYSRFIDENPTHKQTCFARVQRGLCYQSLKNFPAAEKDYNEVIRKFEKCPERELALEQEALIRGDQNDTAGMAENFRKLLKDYPETSAAAKANYWLGRIAYEAKDYKGAIPHLTKARELDPDSYFEKTTQALMSAYPMVEDRAGTARELETYAKKGKDKAPIDVIRWLAESYFESKTYDEAEKQFMQIEERKEATPRDLQKLGQCRLLQSKSAEAVPVFEKFVAAVHEPISRASGLLDLARAQMGSRDFEGAKKSIEEALTLQPEGRLSGEARIIAGDIESARGDHEAAAKVYASVAVILDDEEVTPRALEKAIEAFKKAGREAETKKYLNLLQSRYPEYFQKKKLAK